MSNVKISSAVLQRVLDDAVYIKQEDRQSIRDAIASGQNDNNPCLGEGFQDHARIEKLEEMLKWYIEEDEIHEGDPENQYWIDGKHKAMKLLGIEVEE